MTLAILYDLIPIAIVVVFSLIGYFAGYVIGRRTK
jgi:hypothetical protein